MTFQRRYYKCGVCGVENEYIVYTSDFVTNYPDFDMKPVGSKIPIKNSRC